MQFNKTISVAKGIGIILMVVGHSGCPDLLSRFIYMFHMPLFFFISGYLFNEKYLDKKKDFIVRRLKGLYIPFVKWSLVFLLFHNLFAYFHFYESSYTISEYIDRAFRYITFRGTEQLLGGYWFLKELFLVSVIFLFLLFAISHVINKKYWISVCIVSTLMSLIFAYLLAMRFIHIPMLSSTTMFALACFIGGYVYFKTVRGVSPPLIIGICLLITVLCYTIFSEASYDMLVLTGGKIFPFFVTAMLGTVGVISVAGNMEKISKFLEYTGEKTLQILTFHFLAFKLVSIALVLYHGYSWEMLEQFPIIRADNNFLWIAYFLVGTGLPIAGCLCIDWLKKQKTQQTA